MTKRALLVLLGFAFARPTFAETPWKFVASDSGVSLADGDAPVLFYQRQPKSWNGRFERAHYVHPLYDLDGHELTEDFPADHRHHRGIFWAWHQTWIGDARVGDGWALQDFAWDVRDVRTSFDDAGATIRVDVQWKSSKWLDAAGVPKPFVAEQATIRVGRRSGDARPIDFDIQLRALEPNVRIGGSEDEKGYGGFSPRLRLPKGVEFLGTSGLVEPQVGSIESPAWLDVTGKYGPGDALSGVAMLCHPSTPGFPERWILRRVGSMQNAVFPGREPVAIPATNPLRLRYRLMVHRGAAKPDQVAAWQRDFAASK